MNNINDNLKLTTIIVIDIYMMINNNNITMLKINWKQKFQVHGEKE